MMKPVLLRWGINENSLEKTATAPRITLDHQECGRTQIRAQSQFGLVDGIYEAKDMHRMPPTTEPRGWNFLDETVFLDHRRRAGTKGDADAHEPKGAPWPELEHSVSRLRICREHASPADPNRFAANRLASSR
jgi:hypothetical protein